MLILFERDGDARYGVPVWDEGEERGKRKEEMCVEAGNLTSQPVTKTLAVLTWGYFCLKIFRQKSDLYFPNQKWTTKSTVCVGGKEKLSKEFCLCFTQAET
jgi:hypothetical protein